MFRYCLTEHCSKQTCAYQNTLKTAISLWGSTLHGYNEFYAKSMKIMLSIL